MKPVLAISLGAVVGANLRYLIGLWAARLLPTVPLGTFLVNIVGSFGLALFVTLAARRFHVAPEVHLLVTTGFFGAFTTFSTFSGEALLLAQGQRGSVALAYMVGSVLTGVAAAWLGMQLGHWLAQL